MTIPQQNESSGSFRQFLGDDDGSSEMEYAIMLGLIGVTLMPMAQAVGQKISGIAEGVAELLAPASEPAPLPAPGYYGSAPEDPTLQ